MRARDHELRALRRGFAAAVAGTNRGLLVRVEGAGDVDRQWAADLGLDVVRRTHEDVENGARSWEAVDIPSHHDALARRRSEAGRAQRWYVDAIDALAAGASADDVLARWMPDAEREVFIPAIGWRLVHRGVATVIGAALPPGRAYARAGTSRWHGLYRARADIAAGMEFAARFDIRRFFPSTSIALVLDVMAVAGMGESLIEVVRGLHDVAITRGDDHPGVVSGTERKWERPKLTLLQGTAAASALSELVAAHVLDARVEAEFGEAVHVHRYVDDGLILARHPLEVWDALEFIRDILEPHYTLHSGKTSTPMWTRYDEISWLGKDLGLRGVMTPFQDRLDLMVKLGEAAEAGAGKARALELLEEHVLNPRSSIDAVRETLRVDCPQALLVLDAELLTWGAKRRDRLGKFWQSARV